MAGPNAPTPCCNPWTTAKCGKRSDNPIVKLALRDEASHIPIMLKSKKLVRRRKTASSDPVVIYKGIKIGPINAKRSATSKALRDALRDKAQESPSDHRLTA